MKGVMDLFLTHYFIIKRNAGSCRFCIDYEKVNLCIKRKFPFSLTEELQDALHGAKYFLKLDQRAGYRLVMMNPKDIARSAFRSLHT